MSNHVEKEVEYHGLLNDDGDAASFNSSELELNNIRPKPKSFISRHKLLLAICFVVVPSLTFNVFALSRFHKQAQSLEVGRHSFSGLKYDTTMTYGSSTDFWNDEHENGTLTDPFWEAIDADVMGVAVTEDFRLKHGLRTSNFFPFDHNKKVYTIKAVHHMHCLKNLHHTLRDYDEGREPLVMRDHLYHCLDILRQDLMCIADDTLMEVIPPIPGSKRIIHNGDGETVQCRSYEKLLEWARAPERSACYSQLSDYREVEHSLEHYAHCPDDSPYKQTVDAYFARHGHVDPFEL